MVKRVEAMATTLNFFHGRYRSPYSRMVQRRTECVKACRSAQACGHASACWGDTVPRDLARALTVRPTRRPLPEHVALL